MKKTIKNRLISTILTVLVCTVGALIIAGCPGDSGGGGDTTHKYVCTGGTPADGTADSANMQKCASCNPGYLLVSEACEQLKADAVAGDTPQTEVNVTLTANKDANLYWVLYDSAQTLDATQLKAAVTADAGVHRSDGGVAVVADGAQTILLTGLDALQTYYFYALLEVDDNNQALSTELMFTTDGYAYECENGNPVDEKSAMDGEMKCATDGCDAGYTFDSTDNTCVSDFVGSWAIDTAFDTNTNTCTTSPACVVTMNKDGSVIWGSNCDSLAPLSTKNYNSFENMGTSLIFSNTNTIPERLDFTFDAVPGAPGVFSLNPHSTTLPDNRYLCKQSCAPGQHFDATAGACELNQYICTGGTPVTVTDVNDAPATNGAERCMANSCTTGYTFDTVTETCALNQYICTGGTAVIATDVNDAPATNGDVEKCTSDGCESGYTFDMGTETCALNQYICTGGTAVIATDMDKPDTDGDVEKCVANSCNPGYHFNSVDNTCDANTYTCANGGTAADPGTPGADNGDNYCVSCTGAFWLDGANNSCTAHGTLDAGGNYGVASNGVTITCANASVGDSFTIDGTEYTKRAKADITTANAATSCTTGITNMVGMFSDVSTPFDIDGESVGKVAGASDFNADISHWDTSGVTTMGGMFYGAVAFNQEIGDWDTSNVTNMNHMFRSAESFNNFNSSSIADWDVSSVTTMRSMFQTALAFNQPIGTWEVHNVNDMNSMFLLGTGASFDQDISDWCVQIHFDEAPISPFDSGLPATWLSQEKPNWIGDSSDAKYDCPLNFRSAPALDIDGTPTVDSYATAADVSLIPSKDSKLHWIVYEGTHDAPTDVATLKTAAQDTTMGVARATGVDAFKNIVSDINVTGLIASRSYTLYAGLELDGGSESVFSGAVEFNTVACDPGYSLDGDNNCVLDLVGSWVMDTAINASNSCTSMPACEVTMTSSGVTWDSTDAACAMTYGALSNTVNAKRNYSRFSTTTGTMDSVIFSNTGTPAPETLDFTVEEVATGTFKLVAQSTTPPGDRYLCAQ